MAEKEAFCVLLWIHQGGEVDSRGRKRVTKGTTASGYCDDPTGCYRCPLMHKEISGHPPGHANWVCPACLPEIVSKAKSQGKNIHMTGHYTEGRCQFIGCERPERVEYSDAAIDDRAEWIDEDKIEYPKGYSRFLQLVIGDINS